MSDELRPPDDILCGGGGGGALRFLLRLLILDGARWPPDGTLGNGVLHEIEKQVHNNQCCC